MKYDWGRSTGAPDGQIVPAEVAAPGQAEQGFCGSSSSSDFTYKNSVSSMAINPRISSCGFILYRRVSTKEQSKQEYRSQLDIIKSVYPDFSISHSCIDNITEHVSGLADPEIRMASGLGKCLRLLQRNPFAIILVSNIDRIARRPDIFELIQRQGLGHRIFDASTGLCLDQVVESGDHIKIHKDTKAQHNARYIGIKRYQAAGGTMGSPDIGNWSKQAAAKSRQLAKDRQSDVLKVVKQMVIDGRGHMPPYRDICDEMNERGLRTGQGRFHTPQRLSQLRKNDPVAWDYTRDSYHRPRRWLRERLTVALAEAKAEAQARAQTAVKTDHHQDRRQPMRKPALISYRRVHGLHVACVTTTVVKHHSSSVYDPRRKQTGCDGCRGPPQERGALGP
ncbi:DNA invertase Pin-like site-specific DNA recombinase [Litoreibacter meonggei]|uniref:DNA invertase Pin-like site-specific DNA recombinase n=1 Tax=Litoreibacter meonggei TaxID=1049199 RepID=A0A497WR45_9RHOB|nr:recombinase family protein [Litoreibacter meonggei]RLJ59100.1 DNA invertase Pin-like site-specific DNA recombinase [Litoreibacter meonggei]